MSRAKLSSIDRQKDALRKELKRCRSQISSDRKRAASTGCVAALLPLVAGKQVLSFAPFQDEIDLWPLNQLLAQNGCLILPHLPKPAHCLPVHFFKVTDIDTQLIPSPLGFLEPDPSLCEEVPPAKIEIALIPGLGFDNHHHRLGYGKGCYDHWIPLLVHATTLGIGYREQLIEQLPVAIHDQQLDQILLF